MGVYQFKREQFFKRKKEELWDFICDPKNLQKITPDDMGFDITSKDLPEDMYAGMIISYKVSPLLGIKTTWVTEITQVRDGEYFIDEQRVGPYTMWHHQHLLEEKGGGVLMTDIITYQPPFGILGSIANSLFIRKKLEGIFEYRFKVLEEVFGS
jgi:ligand-binding SRPBCC domain-containing protein